jgi:hypothetical protein
MAKPLPVFLEVGQKKTFASVVDWPGWCRAARTEEAALDALATYAPRYAEMVRRAELRLPSGMAGPFTVVERIKGGAATDFGAPEMSAQVEREKVTAAAAQRMAALVTAAWVVFDVVASETPEELRKGPRGGGRDRDKMIDHVLSAEVAYARKLGIKLKPPSIDDVAAIEAQREAIAAVLAEPSSGEPVIDKGWTTRYAARRIAWHVLDHAWEMQDRRP